MPLTLHLNLHREFFAKIASGQKRVERREQSPHWQARLEGRQYEVIKFRNGYAPNAPEMLVKFRGFATLRKTSQRLLCDPLRASVRIEALAPANSKTKKISRGAMGNDT
jgi:hypothetical protein